MFAGFFFGCLLIPVWGGDLLRKQTLVRCTRGLFIRAWFSPFIFIPSPSLLASLPATPKSFCFLPVFSLFDMCEIWLYCLWTHTLWSRWCVRALQWNLGCINSARWAGAGGAVSDKKGAWHHRSVTQLCPFTYFVDRSQQRCVCVCVCVRVIKSHISVFLWTELHKQNPNWGKSGEGNRRITEVVRWGLLSSWHHPRSMNWKEFSGFCPVQNSVWIEATKGGQW